MRYRKKRAARGPLNPASVPRKVEVFGVREVIYSQGDRAKTILYLQKGAVKLSVVRPNCKEAVVAILGPGDFFGEKCLASEPVRITTATATTLTSVLVIRKSEMIRMLRTKDSFSDAFISYMLLRNLQVEEDLIDQICHSSEKRLARALLRLSHNGNQHQDYRFAEISQDTLARMIGTTRSRVNLFMNKFKKRGFIKYNGTFKRNGGLQINSSLLSMILQK